jgi:putative transposase
MADVAKGKAALMAENALLRQQLIVLQRQVTRPAFTPRDRLLLVLLARLVHGWQAALLIVQPDTVLRWHRHAFRLVVVSASFGVLRFVGLACIARALSFFR